MQDLQRPLNLRLFLDIGLDLRRHPGADSGGQGDAQHRTRVRLDEGGEVLLPGGRQGEEVKAKAGDRAERPRGA